MKKTILYIACILGVLSIVLGAFGAHLLEDHLTIERLQTFETGVRYQFYHVFFLIALGLSFDKFSQHLMKYAFYFCVSGMVLFSGSLYILCLTNNSLFGAITPIGGVSFIAAWFCFFLAIKNT
tara:strand:+ start:46 stop:414 length:369 start_codon:yes stop_codon:yes gene_type:complete